MTHTAPCGRFGEHANTRSCMQHGPPCPLVKHGKQHVASSTSGLLCCWQRAIMSLCFFPWPHYPKVKQLVRTRPPPQLLDGELPFVLAVAKTVALLFTLLCLSLHLFPFCPLSQALFCHTHPLLLCGYTQAHTHFPQGLFSSNKLTSVA